MLYNLNFFSADSLKCEADDKKIERKVLYDIPDETGLVSLRSVEQF
jgi:hypothetical protein